MISIAVCDDEILDCLGIAKNIQDILKEMEISFSVHQFHSGAELLKAIEHFDIIFLDIMMCEMNGITTAQLLRDKLYDKIIIFVSSSREYVFDAFGVEAFDYIIKPINNHKLKSVLQRAVKKAEPDLDTCIFIYKERQKIKLFLKDIYYFEIKGRIVSVHSTSGTVDYYEQLGVLEKNLQEKGFFRCHKSFLVNLKYVSSFNRQELTLDNGETIIIAKRRYQEFSEVILEYIKQNGGMT